MISKLKSLKDHQDFMKYFMTKIAILDFLRSHKDEMHEKFGLT